MGRGRGRVSKKENMGEGRNIKTEGWRKSEKKKKEKGLSKKRLRISKNKIKRTRRVKVSKQSESG